MNEQDQKQGREVSEHKLVWSAVHDLEDWASAPLENGIYVIGTYSGEVGRPVTGLPCTDKFLGENWPDAFVGNVVGRAFQTTLRGRLKDHFERSCNRHIRAYLREHGDHSLSFIYIPRSQLPGLFDVRMWEHFFLSGVSFKWSIRKHEHKSFISAIEEIVRDDPPTDLATWWDPRDG